MTYAGDPLAYISETPAMVRSLLTQRPDVSGALRALPVTTVRVIGTGSSWNAAYAALWPFVLPLQAEVLSPAEFLMQLPHLPSDTLLLGISQQGTSVSVLRAMQAAQARGLRVIGLTGEPCVPLHRFCDISLDMGCGMEDAGATTKGYTATLIAVQRLMRSLAGQSLDALDATFLAAADTLETLLATERAAIEQIAGALAATEDLFLLSDEGMAPYLPELTLKFSETCRCPVRCAVADAFCHGLYNAVSDTTAFLLLPGDGDGALLARLEGYYRKRGNTVCRLDTRSHTPPSPLFLREVPLLQMLFVLTSRARGIDLNTPRDPLFHQIMGSKLEKET